MSWASKEISRAKEAVSAGSRAFQEYREAQDKLADVKLALDKVRDKRREWSAAHTAMHEQRITNEGLLETLKARQRILHATMRNFGLLFPSDIEHVNLAEWRATLAEAEQAVQDISGDQENLEYMERRVILEDIPRTVRQEKKLRLERASLLEDLARAKERSDEAQVHALDLLDMINQAHPDYWSGLPADRARINGLVWAAMRPSSAAGGSDGPAAPKMG